MLNVQSDLKLYKMLLKSAMEGHGVAETEGKGCRNDP